MRSMSSDLFEILEASEAKAAQIERDSLTDSWSLMGQLSGRFALQTKLDSQLVDLRSLRCATASLENRSAEIHLILAKVIEQFPGSKSGLHIPTGSEVLREQAQL